LTMRYCRMLVRRRAPTAGAKQVRQVGVRRVRRGAVGTADEIMPRERWRKAAGLAQRGGNKVQAYLPHLCCHVSLYLYMIRAVLSV
jgi:hypothetical protein